MPAMSAASGWPWPDIRWHAPHANLIPGPPVTDRGAGGCSSGNQSGGFAVPATLAHSYSFALPGALTIPSGRTAAGWILSGMLNAQSGSPAGTVSASWALSSRIMGSAATAHTRTAMRTDVSIRRIRRITAGLLSHFRRRSPVSSPGEGNDAYQEPQDPPGRSGSSLPQNASYGLHGGCRVRAFRPSLAARNSGEVEPALKTLPNGSFSPKAEIRCLATLRQLIEVSRLPLRSECCATNPMACKIDSGVA